MAPVGLANLLSYAALTIGLIFFVFACKYYASILMALYVGWKSERNSSSLNEAKAEEKESGKNLESETFNPSSFKGSFRDREPPFVSIHLPFYNEKNVARRILQACIEIDYPSFEILVADDSRDETVEILKEVSLSGIGPLVKVVHRKDRSGFKGGALGKAVDLMDPRAEYVSVFDADFIPPRDILWRFLWCFEARNGDGAGGDLVEEVKGWYDRNRIGVVQGYQLHCLNKNENWITRGIRCEYSGGYMVERVAQEFLGAMKMITGSVFMIRADILKELGWTHSITEDWDLTLRMYLDGYRVFYTPLIQAPAEIPTTLRALARQRMRWAEGHTYAVKKYFKDILRSPKLTLGEKLEFLYFAPYYLQSLLFLLGTGCWLLAEMLGHSLPFWTAVFGWSLLFSNLLALPLMSVTGLYLEGSAKDDLTGVFSMVVLTYLLAPFQGYAALKGLLERDEGGWIRTLKTGSITDRILRVNLSGLFGSILRPPAPTKNVVEQEGKSRLMWTLVIMTSFLLLINASALSMPDSPPPRTSLSLEHAAQPVDVFGVLTETILTHPDHTSLGSVIVGSHSPGSRGWRRAWAFYLHGPLEADYRLKGELIARLFLFANEPLETDIELKVYRVQENRPVKKVTVSRFRRVPLLEGIPSRPFEFKVVPRKPVLIEEGDTILVEIWFKLGESEGESIVYLAYDSEEAHSQVEFPGIVMPEALLPLLLVAPLLPGLMKVFGSGRKKSVGSVVDPGGNESI
ncbi:MAG: glycosyltransferase [Candidatus Bathyarchaeota archaeon]|nr:glycosyltransferase [Candidatus Bathyarchaeota archaeon]